MAGYKWTNSSVRALAGDQDPIDVMTARVRDLTLTAQDEGWVGPPFDPFDLAERLDLKLIARDELEDARLVVGASGARIEFNPNRARPRVRFSVAHEIGHWLFPDHADEVRYRSHTRGGPGGDDWQVELLCNLAAAEILMPAGSLPDERVTDLGINHMMDLRRHYEVSTEALLLRMVRLTDRAAAVFAAAREKATRSARIEFRLDYLVSSSAWSPPTTLQRRRRIRSELLSECTAVGYTAIGDEAWDAPSPLHIECVGIPGYPGDRYPRIVGFLTPATLESTATGGRIRYVRGDATEPRPSGGLRIIAHVVNNKARRWGGVGFAKALGGRFPQVADEYSAWTSEAGHLRLGEVHFAQVDSDLAVASMVAQAGYGASDRPLIRYRPLTQCLTRLANLAASRGATLHMPLIGTGQAGGKWALVRDLVHEALCMRGIDVTVYVLGEAPMPLEFDDEHQLSLADA